MATLVIITLMKAHLLVHLPGANRLINAAAAIAAINTNFTGTIKNLLRAQRI